MAGAQWLGWAPPPIQRPSGTEGLGAFLQALGQMRQNQLFGQDVKNLGVHQQALSAMDPAAAARANVPTPNMRSMQMQQMMAPGMLQALMPLSPLQRVQMQAEKARLAHWSQRPQSQQYSTPKVATEGDDTGLEPGTVYQASPTGNIDVLQRPDPNDTPEKQLSYWQNVRRIAKGTDPGSTTSRALAKALGQDVEVTEHADVVKLAEDKITEIIGKMRGKGKAADNVFESSSIVVPPKKGDTLQFSRTPSSVSPPKQGQRWAPKAEDLAFQNRVNKEVMTNIKNPVKRMEVYQEAIKLKPIWSELTEDEKISAYKKLAEGWTGEEVVTAFRNAR